MKDSYLSLFWYGFLSFFLTWQSEIVRLPIPGIGNHWFLSKEDKTRLSLEIFIKFCVEEFQVP